jgi:hypothetical protein
MTVPPHFVTIFFLRMCSALPNSARGLGALHDAGATSQAPIRAIASWSACSPLPLFPVRNPSHSKQRQRTGRTPRRWRDLPSPNSRDSVLECAQSPAAFFPVRNPSHSKQRQGTGRTPRRWRDFPSPNSRDSVLECAQSPAAFPRPIPQPFQIAPGDWTHSRTLARLPEPRFAR